MNELDTRGSHFYLALYWAEALAKQTQDSELQARFTEVAKQLASNEDRIVQELNDAQGQSVDVGGYYYTIPCCRENKGSAVYLWGNSCERYHTRYHFPVTIHRRKQTRSEKRVRCGQRCGEACGTSGEASRSY